jgi:hypothetical protein
MSELREVWKPRLPGWKNGLHSTREPWRWLIDSMYRVNGKAGNGFEGWLRRNFRPY